MKSDVTERPSANATLKSERPHPNAALLSLSPPSPALTNTRADPGSLLKVENEPSDESIAATLAAQAEAMVASSARASSSSSSPPRRSATSGRAGIAPLYSKQDVNLGLTGKLAADALAQQHLAEGGALTAQRKYAEPHDARKPDKHWRLYVFKGKEQISEPLRLYRSSMFLIGRDENVCDLVVAHPSCSKQHAVIQFRQREIDNPDGTTSFVIKPYLMDLGSTNGTFLMGKRRDPHRYVELFEQDVIKFGCSTREYVLICANDT